MLLALPLIALLTSAGWVAAVIIVAGYLVGLLPVWLRLRPGGRGRGRSRRREYVVPRELPAPPPFVGRDRELARLREAMTAPSRGPRLVVIHGPAGIGKTSLALYFGHLVTDRFEDGQLFVRLHPRGHGRPAEEVTPAGVLKDLIASIQSPTDPPPGDDLPALRRRYAELTQARRLLVVLDDAPATELVADLLPAGRGCLTVVTSRLPLDRLPAANLRQELDPLPPAEGMRMFEHMLERVLDAGVEPRRMSSPEEKGHAEQIVRRSLCHPSALRLVGTVVGSRRGWSLAPIVRVLDAAESRPSLPADWNPLDVCYALLTEDERRAVRLLGVLDEGEPLAPWMLAALLEVPDMAARGIADRLVHAGLVERVDSETAGVTEYWVQDHVHAYAQRLATAAGDHRQLRATLDRARRDRAAGGESVAVERRVQALQQDGRLSEAMTVAREAVAWAMDQAEPGAQAVAQATLAELYIELGNLEAAEDLARAARAAAEQAGVPGPRAPALRATGRLLRRQGRPAAAVARLTSAIESLDAAGPVAGTDRRAERARLLRHRAAAYADSGRPGRGLADLDEADRLYRAATERAGTGTPMRAGLLWARGTTVARKDRLAQADRLLTEAMAEATSHQQPLWRAWITADRATVRVRAGRYRDALDDAQWALDAFGRMSHRYGTAKCRLVIADARRGLAEQTAGGLSRSVLSTVATDLESALETFRNCGDRRIEATTASELARVRSAQYRPRDATALLRTAMLGFTTVGDRKRAEQARRRLRQWSVRRWLTWPGRRVDEPTGPEHLPG
jgi:tetratricopeptide (TPR) repeat protein